MNSFFRISPLTLIAPIWIIATFAYSALVLPEVMFLAILFLNALFFFGVAVWYLSFTAFNGSNSVTTGVALSLFLTIIFIGALACWSYGRAGIAFHPVFLFYFFGYVLGLVDSIWRETHTPYV